MSTIERWELDAADRAKRIDEAHKLAACDDLLAACKALLEHSCADPTEPCAMQARAAIAKAGGL